MVPERYVKNGTESTSCGAGLPARRLAPRRREGICERGGPGRERPGFLQAGDGLAMLGAAAVSALAAAEGGGHPLEHGTASLKSVIFFF